MTRPHESTSAAPALAQQPPPRPDGFTLMEVLAAVFLTSIVIAAAFGFYINLSDASTRAAATIREGIHASSVLDRIARDLEGARLHVTPEGVDPLTNRWVFRATSDYVFDGSDRLKFVTTSHKPRALETHRSDLAVVAYFVEREEDDSYTLYRWLSPGLPMVDSLLDVQTSEDDRSFVLAEGLRTFSLRFLQDDGEWVGEWDSSQLVQADMLPTAVEISLAMVGEGDADWQDFDEEDAREYSLHAVLPQRPIDLVAMIAAKQQRDALAQAAAGAGGAGTDPDDPTPDDGCADASCTVTVAQCLAANPQGRAMLPPQIKECQCADQYLSMLEERGISCQ